MNLSQKEKKMKLGPGVVKKKPNRKRGFILSGHQIIRRGYGRFSEIVWEGPVYRLSGE